MDLPVIQDNPYLPYTLCKAPKIKKQKNVWYAQCFDKEKFTKSYGYSSIADTKQVFTAILDSIRFNVRLQAYHAFFLNVHTSDDQFFDHKWVVWHRKYNNFYQENPN